MNTMMQQAEQLLEFILDRNVGGDKILILKVAKEVEAIFRFLVGRPGNTYLVTALRLVDIAYDEPKDQALEEIKAALTLEARLSESDKRELKRFAEETARR